MCLALRVAGSGFRGLGVQVLMVGESVLLFGGDQKSSEV